jgi:hypothetical protein
VFSELWGQPPKVVEGGGRGQLPTGGANVRGVGFYPWVHLLPTKFRVQSGLPLFETPSAPRTQRGIRAVLLESENLKPGVLDPDGRANPSTASSGKLLALFASLAVPCIGLGGMKVLTPPSKLFQKGIVQEVGFVCDPPL